MALRVRRLPCEYQFRGRRRHQGPAGRADHWQARDRAWLHFDHRHYSRQRRPAEAARRRRAPRMDRDAWLEEEKLFAVQSVSGSHCQCAAERLALPCRLALPIHLRRWAGALLLPAARLSWRAPGRVHKSRSEARVPDGKNLRSALHDQLRPPDLLHRSLARPANFEHDAWRHGWSCEYPALSSIQVVSTWVEAPPRVRRRLVW